MTEKVLTWASIIEGAISLILFILTWRYGKLVNKERARAVEAEIEVKRARRALAIEIRRQEIKELTDDEVNDALSRILSRDNTALNGDDV